jgi:hypothetical protein
MAVLVLVSMFSFWLGVLAGREGKSGEVLLERLTVKEEMPAAVESASQKVATTTSKAVPPPIKTGGEVVASKTGTKYYLPWCGTAKRIKEENKVWFSTKAEAEAAGYEPAKNCKGL